MRRAWTIAAVLAAAGMLCLTGCGKADQEAYQELSSEYNNLAEIVEQLRTDYDDATRKYDEQQKEVEALKTEKEALENEYRSYQEQLQPYMEYILALQGEQGGTASVYGYEAYALPSAQQPEAQASAAELGAAYDTGITYENLLEYPKKCMGKRIRFTGTIVDAEVSDSDLFLIIAVDSEESKPLLLSAPVDWVNSGIEYGMTVTVFGVSAGVYDEAVAGGDSQRMPGAVMDYIVQG